MLCWFLQVSVESLSEESSSQGMIVHPAKLLIKKTWVTWNKQEKSHHGRKRVSVFKCPSCLWQSYLSWCCTWRRLSLSVGSCAVAPLSPSAPDPAAEPAPPALSTRRPAGGKHGLWVSFRTLTATWHEADFNLRQRPFVWRPCPCRAPPP